MALLNGDVTSEPLLPVDGFLPVRTVLPDLREAAAADEQTSRRWYERLAEVADLALGPDRSA